MNDAAVSKPGAYAHVRVREPAGERSLGTTVTIGGAAADTNPDVIVPGASPGVLLTVERRGADWFAIPVPGAQVLLDGRAFKVARELHKDAVLSIGDAQIVVMDDSRTRLRLDVQHLVGNQTIPPVVTVTAVETDAADEDVEIRATPPDSAAVRLPLCSPPSAASRQRPANRSHVRRSLQSARCSFCCSQ